MWYIWNGYRGDLIAAINASMLVHWFNALSARRRSPEPMATMELSSARCCVLQGKLEQRVICDATIIYSLYQMILSPYVK